jgi:hypothetical protein
MGILELDFGICADSGHDEDGHPEIGLDHYGPVGEASGAKGAHVHPFGFDSRPLDPDATADSAPKTGCSALVINDGDRMNMMPLEDPRVVKKLPKQRKGGSRQYCADGNYGLFEGLDPAGKVREGSYIASVKYEAGDSATKAHVFRMDKRTKGKEQISLLHGEGHGLTIAATGKKPASLRNTKGNAGFTTDDDGNTISGKTKVIGALTVGPPGAAQGVVSHPQFAAMMQQLLTIVASIVGTGGTAGAPAAALAGQLAAMQTKLLKGT